MKSLYDFLSELEEKNIFFKLSRIRDDSIMVEIAVPGERWEVEFFSDEHVEVERFKSMGDVEDESALEILFEKFGE